MGEQLVSTVYFSENCSREHFVSKIMEIYESPLQKAKKVFVKPNIVSYEAYPTTTHQEVLEAILKRLSGHEIVVGDAPAIDAGRSNKILQKSPLSKVCWMSLDVNAMVHSQSMENSECILCGQCVDNCPKGVIKYAFGSTTRNSRTV